MCGVPCDWLLFFNGFLRHNFKLSSPSVRLCVTSRWSVSPKRPARSCRSDARPCPRRLPHRAAVPSTLPDGANAATLVSQAGWGDPQPRLAAVVGSPCVFDPALPVARSPCGSSGKRSPCCARPSCLPPRCSLGGPPPADGDSRCSFLEAGRGCPPSPRVRGGPSCGDAHHCPSALPPPQATTRRWPRPRLRLRYPLTTAARPRGGTPVEGGAAAAAAA